MKKKVLFLVCSLILTILIVGCDTEGSNGTEIRSDEQNAEQNAEQETKESQNDTKDETTETKLALEELYEILTDSKNVAKKDEIIALLSGKSAYEIATGKGFSGTEEEWLASLKGEDGKSYEKGYYSLWLVGKGEPNASQADENVLYLDAKNGIVYYYSEDEWKKVIDFSQKSPTVCTVTLCLSEKNRVSKEVNKGDCIELPTPEKTGRVFLGWFTGPGANDAQITSYSPIVKDMLLYPKFGEVKYKITYIIGEEIYAEQEYYYEETIVPPTVEEGGGVSGWKDIPSEMPAKDITVYATIEGKYVVRFMDENGEILVVQYVKEGESAVAPTPEGKEGYDFIGWNRNYETVTEDVDVVAQYKVKEFTVTFYDTDDTVLKEEKVSYGSGATAPSPKEKEGYEFLGWSADYSCVTSDLDIKAQYKEKEKEENNEGGNEENNEEPVGTQEPNENQEPGGTQESGGNEGEEEAQVFIIIEDNLYFNKETPEKVVLNIGYTRDMLCQEILSDEKLQAKGYRFEIDNQIQNFELSTYYENGECIVPIILLHINERIECFVEVVLVA